MREIRWRYLKLFLFIPTLLFMAAVLQVSQTPIDEIIAADIMEVQTNLDFRSSIIFRTSTETQEEGLIYTVVRDRDCIMGPDSSIPALLKLLENKIRLFEFLLEGRETPIKVRVAFAATQGLILLVFTALLSLSLYISFNMTLWLLSKFMQSNIWLPIIVLIDFTLAVIMPPMLTTFGLSIFSFASVISVGGALDFSYFHDYDWIKFVLAQTGFELVLSMGAPMIVALFYNQIGGVAGALFAMIVGLYVAPQLGYDFLATLLRDINKVFHLDFNVPLTETMFNYAITIDLLFSATYLFPCVALVFMQRSATTREIFLRIVQKIAEHPRGPLVAVSRGLTWVLRAFKNALSRS
jgi:hypothetical protein